MKLLDKISQLLYDAAVLKGQVETVQYSIDSANETESHLSEAAGNLSDTIESLRMAIEIECLKSDHVNTEQFRSGINNPI